MIDVFNKVFTKIEDYLITDLSLTLSKSSNFTSTETSTPTTFPMVYIHSIGAQEVAQDFEFNSFNAMTSIIEVQVFDQSSAVKARTLSNQICDGMKKLGYSLTISPYESDLNGNKRFIARFRRVIASDDILLK